MALFSDIKIEVPDWVTYPDDDWTQISPAQAGFNLDCWSRFMRDVNIGPTRWGGEFHGPSEWGAVLTCGGYLVHTWGNRHYSFQTASLGKAFTWAVFGLAVGDGLIDPDEPIHYTWTGEGELSHPHKYLNTGHHIKLTWRHLLGTREGEGRAGHYGGFPVTNGYFWRKGQQSAFTDLPGEPSGWDNWIAPDWSSWTGDPFHDNYAHVEPGTVCHYSSGGIWRLTQALTAVWGKDIKDVLDERLFGPMGVPPDRWDWLPGRHIFEAKNFYPNMPGYGDYVDPPYELCGNPVRGGGGWVVMNASDLARFGHLVATRGIWKRKRLIGEEWIRGHHGGNDSEVSGESTFFTAMGRVTAKGIDHLGGPGRDPSVPLRDLMIDGAGISGLFDHD